MGLLAPGRSGRRRAVEALPSRSARLSGLRLGRLGEAGRHALLCRAGGRYPKRGVCMFSIPLRPGPGLPAYASATLSPFPPWEFDVYLSLSSHVLFEFVKLILLCSLPVKIAFCTVKLIVSHLQFIVYLTGASTAG